MWVVHMKFSTVQKQCCLISWQLAGSSRMAWPKTIENILVFVLHLTSLIGVELSTEYLEHEMFRENCSCEFSGVWMILISFVMVQCCVASATAQ